MMKESVCFRKIGKSWFVRIIPENNSAELLLQFRSKTDVAKKYRFSKRAGPFKVGTGSRTTLACIYPFFLMPR
jgi:hypothetical protein